MDNDLTYAAEPVADAYAQQHTSALLPIQQAALYFTLKNHSERHMVSGHLQGQLLRMISGMQKPERILEIGTFTGFSALCLAEGMPATGLLYTLELREKDANIARGFFNQSPWQSQIKSLVGNAADTIPLLNETWDLVFIDADKTGYIQYFDLVLPQLRSGGIILADNVLFHGEVLQPEIKGKNAKAIAAFNAHVNKTTGIDTVMLTVRDGLMMIRKH